MPQPLISLVVPVYRAEAYLPACVQSIRAQRYGALDVVFVDDGSPDRCPELLDRYAREDARIRVIHQPNAGQAAARNAGVAAARGAYLTFVDSDDQIEPDLVGTLLRAMTQAGADAAICDARTFHGDAPPAPAKRGGVEVMTGAQAMRRMLYQRDYDTAPWGKMYRTELVRAHPFPEGRIFEDLFAVYRMLFDAERVAYVREPLYLYRINPEGTMRQAFRPAVLDAADAADEIVSFAQSRCPEALPAALARRFSAYCQVLRWMRDVGPGDPLYARKVSLWRAIRADRWRMLADAQARPKNRAAAACTLLGMNLFSRLR